MPVAPDRAAMHNGDVEPDLIAVIARRYWAANSSERHEAIRDAVRGIVLSVPEWAPAMIRALVQAAPAGEVNWIGASVIEDLVFEAKCSDEPLSSALKPLLAASLDEASLFAVLSGVWPKTLEGMEIDQHLRGVLSEEQIAWLLDGEAPGRAEVL